MGRWAWALPLIGVFGYVTGLSNGWVLHPVTSWLRGLPGWILIPLVVVVVALVLWAGRARNRSRRSRVDGANALIDAALRPGT